MIWLYSGTPGSGKSYHAACDIFYRIKRKNKMKNKVIGNFPIALTNKNYTYLDNSEITPAKLRNYARLHHVLGVEGQTLVILDEAQIIFNSRSWNSSDGTRMEWIIFFTQHRKLGFDFILIAQNDRMIDRQIRSLVEYEVAHLKIGNYFRFLPITVFLAVQRWYGQKMKLAHELIFYRKKIAAIYDTYKLFSQRNSKVRCRKLSTACRKWCGKGIKGFPPRRLRKAAFKI